MANESNSRWDNHRPGTKITVFDKSETRVFIAGDLSDIDIEYLDNQLLNTKNTIRFDFGER